MTVNPGTDYNNSKFVITLDTTELPYLSVGEKPSITLNVRGLLTLSKLVGTWEFEEVLDLEEMELWLLEYEDDPEMFSFASRFVKAQQ